VDWGYLKIERLSKKVSSLQSNKFHGDANNLNIFFKKKTRKHQNRFLHLQKKQWEKSPRARNKSRRQA